MNVIAYVLCIVCLCVCVETEKVLRINREEQTIGLLLFCILVLCMKLYS